MRKRNLSVSGEEEGEGIGEGEDTWLWLSEEADVIEALEGNADVPLSWLLRRHRLRRVKYRTSCLWCILLWKQPPLSHEC